MKEKIQQLNICLMSSIETLEQSVKYVQNQL